MKLKFAVKDVPYMRAVAEIISKAERNIRIEISGDLNIEDDELLITDLTPQEYTSATGKRSTVNVVFITTKLELVKGVITDRIPCFIYKYSRASEMLADIRLKYYSVLGSGTVLQNPAKLCSVATDGECSSSSVFSLYLARQYIYHVGGDVLLIPFTYIDMSSSNRMDRNDAFVKMMYYISTDREVRTEAFIQRDQSGICFIRTGKGINPIAQLDPEEARMLIEYFSSHAFDLVIMDFGNVLSRNNANFASNSEYRFWLTEKDEDDGNEIASNVYGERAFERIDMRVPKDKIPIIADNHVRRMFSIDA